MLSKVPRPEKAFRKLFVGRAAGRSSGLKTALALGVLLAVALLIASLATSPTRAFSSRLATRVPSDLQDLFVKAQRVGSVRVIVGLNTTFQPEGELGSPQAVQIQRNLIAALQEGVLQKMAGYNVNLIARYKFIPYIAVEVDAAALADLAALAEITTITEDVPVPLTLASSIPVIGADDAWLAGYTGSGQTVAILDTGVDKTHPFFSTGGNKVVSEACYSSNQPADSASTVCPGGVTESTAPGSGVNCDTSIPGCDHGTHVAGIAAGNDGAGPNVGVAKDADLIAIQVFSRIDDISVCFPSYFSFVCVGSFPSDQMKALERILELHNTTSLQIASVNMSLGGRTFSSTCDDDPLKPAIDNLRSVGIATVIASGNGFSPDGISEPACISTAVSVGATEDDDDVASFSNVATFLDLLAPGVSIDSSVPGGGIATFSGTSMAAPHVAGAWAVIKQKAPAATVDQVLTAFRDTGTSVDDNRFLGTVTDMRRINLDLALNQFGVAPSLSISKTVTLTNDPAQRGDPITYTIVVANGGTADAAGIRVTDTLPAYIEGTGLDTTQTIAAGGRMTFTLNPTVAEDAPFGETITNTAYYSHSSGSGQSSAAFTVEAGSVELSIDKIVDLTNDPAQRGDPITYTIVVANGGTANAVGVRVTDTLPAYVEGTGLDITRTIAAGERMTFTLNPTVAADAPFGETITNTAYYSHASGSGQSSATFTVEAAAAPSLSILKIVSPGGGFARAGDPLTYTIVVANSGSLDAVGVRITDTLPAYVEGTGLDTTRTVTAGESITFTLNVTVAAGAPLGETITNTAFYNHSSSSGRSSAIFTVSTPLYLPFIVKD